MEAKKINGWNMLDSYQEGQAIYGRDSEIESITESIQYNVQTFLYGKSGIGKTSLLQAGVFPELRKLHFFPVVIRLAFYQNESLNAVVKRLVIEEAQKVITEVGKTSLSYGLIDSLNLENCSLYEFFTKTSFEDENGTPFIPALIFDQFEETINNEDNWQHTVDFLKNDLYDLMDNSTIIKGEALPYTNYRIVISMREDYLYCFEDIIDRYALWECRYNRFRIKALDDIKADEVIRRTSGENGLERGNEDKIINTIIKIVKINSGTRFTEINTALLSLICSLLYDNSEDKCIHLADLRNINVYLNSYYDDICTHIGGRATKYLETHLLTTDGRRSSMDEAEALASKKINQQTLDYLVKKRLLRKIKTDNTSIRYEYIHDLFAKMVYKKLNEDKTKRLYPELRTVSKKLDKETFLKNIVITSIILVATCVVILLIHSRIVHEIWAIFPKGFTCSTLYFLSCLFPLYLLPIIIKRLHDVGKSGWYCFMLPISIAVILISLLFFEDNMIGLIGNCAGCVLLIYLLLICLKKSGNTTKKVYYSSEYEIVFNMGHISNLIFIKALSLELLCWIICCFITDLIYDHLFITWYDTPINNVSMGDLIPRLPLVGTDKFGHTIYFPSVLSRLPIMLILAPSLKARIKSLGYSSWWSFIPYVNILFLIAGLLPDKLLQKLHLIRIKEDKKQDTDDIFKEINDSLIVYNSSTVNGEQSLVLKALFIPFYGLVKCFDKNIKIGNRISCLSLGIINFMGVYACAFIILIGFYENIISNLFFLFCIFVIFFFAYFFQLEAIACKQISQLLQETPSLTANQIANELKLQPNYTEKLIQKINKEKGD